MLLTFLNTAFRLRGVKVKPIDLAIAAAGSVTELAKRLKVSPQVVIHWKKRGIPVERVLKVEKATGVSRSVLAPRIYPSEQQAA